MREEEGGLRAKREEHKSGSVKKQRREELRWKEGGVFVKWMECQDDRG